MLSFLTSMCAIIGGVFTGAPPLARSGCRCVLPLALTLATSPPPCPLACLLTCSLTALAALPPPSCPAAVSGIVDATVYHGQQALKKKADLGKLT